MLMSVHTERVSTLVANLPSRPELNTEAKKEAVLSGLTLL